MRSDEGSLGYKLRTARKYHRPPLTQEQLARRLNVSRGLVAMWETNARRIPDDQVALFCDIARLPVEWFYDGRPGPPQATTVPNAEPLARPELAPPVRVAPVGKVSLRMAGSVPAGGAWGDPLESEFYELMDAKFDGPKRFVAKVKGDSCYPALQQGDLAVWEVDDLPRYGTIVLVESLPDYGVTVKELIGGADGRPTLRAVNPSAQAPPLDRDWKVTARLVGIERRQPGMPELTLYDPGGLTVAQLRPFANARDLRVEDDQGIPSEEAFGTPTIGKES